MTKEELHRWLYDYDEYEQKFAAQDEPEPGAQDLLFPNSNKYDETHLFGENTEPLFREDDTITLCRNPRFSIGDYHAHQFVEIVYVYQGSCTNLVEGVMLPMQSGDFCFISPDVYHFISKNESIVINILVRRDRFVDLCGDPRLGDNPITQFASDFSAHANRYKYLLVQNAEAPEIRSLIEQMIGESVDRGPFGTLMLETLFLQTIGRLLTRHPTFSFAKGEFCSKEVLIVDILRYIRQNYRTVTLKSLSSHFRYTPTHICRLLSRYIGLSFSRIVTQIRMEKAAEMLLSTDLPVQEVALRNGYESVEHFHRTFKEYYHETPRQLRTRSESPE